MARTEVFNTRRTRLMRRHVSRTENVVTVAIALALTALLVWVLGTRDDYDAEERDLPIELLYESAGKIELYNRPLKLWSEPGEAAATGGLELGAFPGGVVDEDWQPVGRVRTFAADNLYQKINGEAEKFIKQGFVSLSYLLLRSGTDGTELALELYDQGDLGGSLGIFAGHVGDRVVESRNGVTFFRTGAGVIGRTGPFFFRVAADRVSARVGEKSLALVDAFSSLGAQPTAAVPEPEEPAGFRLLRERLGLAEADIQFEQSNVFQYDFASRFWFGHAGLDDKARVFVHIADDESGAEQLLEQLLEEQSYEYSAIPGERSWSLLQHEFQHTFFAVSRDGRYLYGAEKVASLDQVETLMQRLQGALTE